MNTLSVLLLLLAAASAHATWATRHLAQASANQTADFATTHSASGTAVGNVAWTGKGTGQDTQIGGLNAYVTTPNVSYSAAVLLITDIYGYKADNTRVWADNLAKQGFLVVVPDYFSGNPRTPSDPASTFASWTAQFPRSQVLNQTDAVLRDIKQPYPAVQRVGVVGFCWGGQYAVLLTAGSPPNVSASVVYHGSLLMLADIQAINAPISFQQSDPALDNNFNTTFYNQVQAMLADKRAQGLDAQLTYYPGQPHGYSLRGGSDPNATESATAAFNAGAAFLQKHLVS